MIVMSTQVRVRFAPSPTGHLHIGGARTALYNYLFAKGRGGVFVLRIEDTDLERHDEEAARAIVESMEWLGMRADEGPFYQSDRFDLYRAEAMKLVASGRAYRCFCGKERLEALRDRQKAEGANIGYDGACRALPPAEAERRAAAGEEHVVRFRMEPGEIVVDDLVHGPLRFDGALLDDLVILKSTMTPTYNFSVAVDDGLMGITHVIRGDDHISNTPKQLRIIAAMGMTPPVYAHIPMILGADKQKLSKRHGAVSVLEYRKLGYLPDAVFNYLALLGWAFDGATELFSRDELVARFSLEKVSRNPSVFDMEKLTWMNAEYLKKADPALVTEGVRPFLEAAGMPPGTPPERVARIVRAVGERMRRFDEAGEHAGFLFRAPETCDEKAAKHLAKPESADFLRRFAAALPGLGPLDAAALEAATRAWCEREGVPFGKLVHPLRGALTGKSVSFGIFDCIELLGRDETIRRIDAALGRAGGAVAGA